MSIINLVIDENVLEKYCSVYFKLHPKAKNKPIKSPIHPSINEWMILKRPMMNALKQKWKDFIIWYIDQQGYTNLHIDKCEMTVRTYYSTNRRHDVDNTVPKFIIDGLVLAGLVVDDDSKHIKKLTLECYVDSDNPRTEITIYLLEDKKENKNGCKKSKK